jgi:hypothetical protein
VPNLATVNAVELADATDHATTRTWQVYLILQSLYNSSSNGNTISHPEITAAFELMDDLRDDISAIQRALGYSEQEVAL